jgi:hypothetical protein
MSIQEVYAWLEKMENNSIYDGNRLAQPDEVANYKTGDGLEKAFLLANIILAREPASDIEIVVDGEHVVLRNQAEYRFLSAKGLEKQVNIAPDRAITIES